MSKVTSKNTGVESASVVTTDAQKMLEGLVNMISKKKGNRGTEKVDPNKDSRAITTVIERSEKVQTIIVPENMNLLAAAKELTAMYDNEEQVIDMAYSFEGWEWQDALVAIKRVSEKAFGWMRGVTIQTMFGEIRPAEIDIAVNIVNGDKVMEKCFYGKFAIGTWEGAIANVGVNHLGANISIKGKKKYSEAATFYFKSIEQWLREYSIYRGKTVVVTGTRTQFGHNHQFELIENKPSNKIRLNKDEASIVDEYLIDDLDELGKRIYLFTGPYGNGKTETAMRIGKEANNRGMAMFYLKDTTLFDIVLNQCKNYQPCVLFVEDIDEIASGNDRDADMNKILNTIDGFQTKNNNLRVIFTTNHENKINPALRRPGRIDQIVFFRNPNEDTRIAIMMAYFEGMNGCSTLDFKALSDKIGDVSASVVAEVCKRAYKQSVKHGSVTDARVYGAIVSIQDQVRLMAEPIDQLPVEMQFCDLFRKVIMDESVIKRIIDAWNNN